MSEFEQGGIVSAQGVRVWVDDGAGGWRELGTTIGDVEIDWDTAVVQGRSRVAEYRGRSVVSHFPVQRPTRADLERLPSRAQMSDFDVFRSNRSRDELQEIADGSLDEVVQGMESGETASPLPIPPTFEEVHSMTRHYITVQQRFAQMEHESFDELHEARRWEDRWRSTAAGPSDVIPSAEEPWRPPVAEPWKKRSSG